MMEHPSQTARQSKPLLRSSRTNGRDPFKKQLKCWLQAASMRVGMSAIVAVLIAICVDEHFSDARYRRATMSIISQIARAFV
jgi:hypothetical protein